MIIEGNTFVFLNYFEILLHEKIRTYHMAHFISISFKRQIMHLDSSIFKDFSRITDSCLNMNYICSIDVEYLITTPSIN